MSYSSSNKLCLKTSGVPVFLSLNHTLTSFFLFLLFFWKNFSEWTFSHITTVCFSLMSSSSVNLNSCNVWLNPNRNSYEITQVQVLRLNCECWCCESLNCDFMLEEFVLWGETLNYKEDHMVSLQRCYQDPRRLFYFLAHHPPNNRIHCFCTLKSKERWWPGFRKHFVLVIF